MKKNLNKWDGDQFCIQKENMLRNGWLLHFCSYSGKVDMKRGKIKYVYIRVDLGKILTEERENSENWEHLY